MDSTKDEYEKLAKDPHQLQEYLAEQIQEMSRTLTDDEEFCNEDIDTTMEYVQTMKRKFLEKSEEFQTKLEKIRRENQTTSEENRKKLDEEIKEINELYEARKYPEAWKKFKAYESSFQQRSTLIQQIPKLHMNEDDIERCFAVDYRPTIADPPPTLPVPTTATIENAEPDSLDDVPMTSKEEKRQKKVTESVRMSEDNEELNHEQNEQTVEHSQFGARSKRQQNPPAAPPPPTTTTKTRKFCFSTRLQSTPAKTQPASINFTLNPVSHYQHDRNQTLLMACSYQYIVLFKSQRNRLDLWHLGAIERGTQAEQKLEWHDGLIISMGCINNDFIYMFTEREFVIYCISEQRRRTSRILPRGNDDEWNTSTTEYYRGIGTIDGKFWYHMYSNRSNHWTLSKTTLDTTLTHCGDIDLTLFFPDVKRFIYLSVMDKITFFLVQMTDSNYAVVSYSTTYVTNPPVILIGAKQPLTIYSAYNQSLKQHLCFINDPSVDTLHVVTKDRYLQSCPIVAYAINYHAEKNELMIVANNLISSINLNQVNCIF